MAQRIALLSVTDKTGLTAFARRLSNAGFELVSTGGSARVLREAGLPVRDVSSLTGFPEMLDGRVKTLHPKVHGGLLGIRENPQHAEQMRQHGIAPISLVAVNLYRFEETAARSGVGFDELIENIDIGGPAMIRSAAKNFGSVAVVTSPADYDRVAAEIESAGEVGASTRWELARKAFAVTAAYDAAISSTLNMLEPSSNGLQPALKKDVGFPASLRLQYSKISDLRYGENPHQSAALYRMQGVEGGIAGAEVLQGKELSYNNLVDLEACWDLVNEFEPPAVAIIKHTNPAGCATGENLADAYRKALACDPVSAFGGVIGVSRELDGEAAQEISKLFVECIAAPGYSEEARRVLAAKKNLRMIAVAPERSTPAATASRWVMKSISGGLLVQSRDPAVREQLDPSSLKVVTRRAPSRDELDSLLFGWKVSKHVKSNAIVFARAGQTLAVGAGQMSRVDSVKVAAMKAQLALKGSVVASDAFFPFPDGVEEAARYRITAVIQPGGSVRDNEVIAACDRLNLAMVFTGIRHFRH